MPHNFHSHQSMIPEEFPHFYKTGKLRPLKVFRWCFSNKDQTRLVTSASSNLNNPKDLGQHLHSHLRLQSHFRTLELDKKIK